MRGCYLKTRLLQPKDAGLKIGLEGREETAKIEKRTRFGENTTRWLAAAATPEYVKGTHFNKILSIHF